MGRVLRAIQASHMTKLDKMMPCVPRFGAKTHTACGPHRQWLSLIICRYPGVDYLGVGYDLTKGNPDGEPPLMIDPGFRCARSNLAVGFVISPPPHELTHSSALQRPRVQDFVYWHHYDAQQDVSDA